ncbi:MAG TPA: hypothetical protein VNN79_11690, partial [Actinomycetota bacterium]|nr:hypothetical protein [Actinomycetota bacterium]
DPVTQQVVLFGGSSAAPNSGTNLGDTWTWNGSDWTEEHPDHSPPARYVAAMAFDPSRGTVVLFGGSQGVHKFLGDTWEWAGSDWTELSPAASPPSHAWGAMAFDSNGNALLYGGFDGDPGRDNSSYSFGAKPAVVRLVGIHGGAVATRPASTKHPLSTSLRVGETPTGGMVSITQLPHSTLEAPAGYAFLPAQDVIAAPKGSSGSPLTLRFTLDPSLIPRDPEDTVSLFRTEFGRTPKLVTACTAAVPPKPDPCVSSETVSGGALKITVSTTSAATWNFAVRRPDAKIKLGSDSSSVGGGIYNLTGFRQTRTVEAMRGVTKTFDIGVQNDGTSVTGFRLKGLGSGTDFTVKYLTGLTGTTDITSGVVAGTYTLRNVPADGTKFIRLQITVRSTAAIGSMFGRLVTAVSTQAGVARDAVKGVASVIA